MEAKPLGKETLDTFMTEFAALAEHYRPALPGQRANPNEDEERYLKFARLAVDAATRLAPYQSPTFRAMVLAPAPETNGPRQDQDFSPDRIWVGTDMRGT
jgi:hypothetical protein